MKERLCLLLFAALLILPSLAEGYRADSEDAIVRIGESVEVTEGDTIRGDVVSIGGSITVRGYVDGDAVAVGGSIVLEYPGVIEGDAVSVGGGIEKGEGTRVGGETVEVTLPGFRYIFPRGVVRGAPRLFPLLVSSPFPKVMGVVVLLIITVLLVLFLPTPSKRLSSTVESHLPRSILFGILGELAIIPLCVFLAVSVIGIPLIPVALIAIGAAFLFGLAGVGLLVGQIFLKRAGTGAPSAVASVAIGVILVELFSLLGAFLALVVSPLGGGLKVLGLLILYFAWTVGLGSVILTRFGTREWSPRQPKQAEAPAKISGEKEGEGEVP